GRRARGRPRRATAHDEGRPRGPRRGNRRSAGSRTAGTSGGMAAPGDSRGAVHPIAARGPPATVAAPRGRPDRPGDFAAIGPEGTLVPLPRPGGRAGDPSRGGAED